MKLFSIVFVVYLISLSSSFVCAEVLIKPNDININYYGRFDFSNSLTSVSFNWPGSIIEASFPGPSIGVELDCGDTNYFNVEIDGVLVDSLAPSTVTHRTIRTNLTSVANHTIRIILRTNGSQTCAFGGFYLADGKALAAKPAQPSRKMEFIGDSWTDADVVGEPLGSTAYNSKSFNATLAYSRLTSLAYHAQDKIIARGGCGLVKSNNGGLAMPVRYPEILCDDTAKWNFSSWTPDVVVIFLGINDGVYNNNVDSSVFRTAYTNFINTVRSHYPNVPIILGNLPGAIPTNIQTLAQSFTKMYTFTIPFTLFQAKSAYYHPDASQHRQIANALIPVVKTATGWDTTPPVNVTVPDLKSKVPYESVGNGLIIKTSQDKISFKPELAGITKEIVVYTCSGRPIRKLVTINQTVSLERDFGLAEGMYIVKTASMR